MLGASVTQKVEGAPRLSVSFLFAGDHWRFDFLSETFYVRDSKGLRLLLLLTENPGRKYSLSEVAVAVEASGETERRETPEEMFRQRLRELRAERQAADEWSDLGRRLWMQMEVERMAEELDGRSAAADEDDAEGAERARKSIGNALRRTIGSIARYCPLLGAHLNVSVRTGGSLAYMPDPLTGIRWRRERIFEQGATATVNASTAEVVL